MRDAESRGIDRALLLSDRSFAGADTLATAYTLSLGVRDIGDFDLILCGKMAVDGDTAQIGPELAENLGIPHVTDVSELVKISDKKIVCKKITDKGHQLLEVELPALLTVVKDINMPRLPSIPGIEFSLKAPFEMKNAEDLNADASKIGLSGSPTQVVKTYVPERTREAVVVEGEVETQAVKLMEIIREMI